MPNERSNVRFPLWRKKMDGAMFDHHCTVLPNWVRDNVFDLNVLGTLPSKSDR